MYPKAPQTEGLWTDRVHGIFCLSNREAVGHTDRGLDVIRAYQSKHLYDNFKLTNLFIYRNSISKSFDHQVLAT
jgi:histone deacetylase 6